MDCKGCPREISDKAKIFMRDNWTCQICGIEVFLHDCNGPRATIDHIIPQAKDGSNDFRNLHCTCEDCNIKKKDDTTLDWFKFVHFQDKVDNILAYVEALKQTAFNQKIKW